MRLLTLLPTPLLTLLVAAADLKIEVILDVDCSRPSRAGDNIAVHYKGTLQASGDEFDESYKRGKPFNFVLGAGQVIKGWDQGLTDMCPGEKRILTIPPELAYGEYGAPPAIPGGSTLVFDTELMEIIGVEQEKLPQLGAVKSDTTPSVTSTAPVQQESQGVSSVAAVAPSVPILASSQAFSYGVVLASSSAVVLSSTAAMTSSQTAGAFGIQTSPPKPPTEDDKAEDLSQGHNPDHKQDHTKPKPAPHSSSSPKKTQEEGNRAECHLLGPFALIVQGALGLVALLSLVYKRWRETPKRPWKIFFFDVSKQVVGSMLTHVLNLAMSMLGAVDMVNSAAKAAENVISQSGGRRPNPCSYYLLNLAIDTTVGIPILYLLLKVLHGLFRYTPLANPPQSIKSGNYGTPPRVTWWLKQALIYFIGLTGMKMFVWFLFFILPWLPWVGDWALRWTEGSEALQITFALFIFPLAMNAIQYWVIDNFIMDKTRGADGQGQGYERVHGDESDDESVTENGTAIDEDMRTKDNGSPPVAEIDPIPVSVYHDRPDGEGSRGGSPRSRGTETSKSR